MKILKLWFFKYGLVLVALLAFLIRIVSLRNIPAGFNADEASLGYDAYSILLTGRDQWGSFLPIVLKSFGDFKSPIYAYLTVPSIFIFGLTKFATRLPNVIVGTLATVTLYFLLKEILGIYFKKLKITNIEGLSLFGAFLLAVNPWAVMLSRGAVEANLITLFLPLGILFFLKGIKNFRFLILSAVFFGISLFTYHSAKLVTPVVIAGLLIIFRRKWLQIKLKKTLPGLSVLVLFFIGLIVTFRLGGGARISERSIFQGALEQGAVRRIQLIQTGANPLLARVLHNKYQVVAERFFGGIQQYFSLRFLFVSGAAETYYGMVPGIGVIYWVDGFLIIGSLFLLFDKSLRGFVIILFAWLALTALPAALATGVGYSGNRAGGMIPILQIIEVAGILGWYQVVHKLDTRLVKSFAAVLCLLFVFQIYGFANAYFIGSPAISGEGMLAGNLEAFSWLSKNVGTKPVVVSRSLSEPQIFAAFAGVWNPSEYQASTKSWNLEENGVVWVDQIPSYTLANYTFTSIDWDKVVNQKGIILVGRPGDYPKNLAPDKVFNYPDGKPAVYIKFM